MLGWVSCVGVEGKEDAGMRKSIKWVGKGEEGMCSM